MFHNKLNYGMSLIETAIAVALMMIIGGALVSMVMATLGVAGSANARSAATRLAEQRMEEVKNAEQVNKANIQKDIWTSITGLDDHVSPPRFNYKNSPNFFTRSTTVTPIANGMQVAVTVSWRDRSRNESLVLTTNITKWQ